MGSALIRGTLELLVMRSVARQPLHSCGIAVHLARDSGTEIRVNPATLLGPLRKLERRGWLIAEWRRSENGRRARYYSLTASGRRGMARETAVWRRRVATFERLVS